MYIKQIIIQGFKSYKEQTVMEPFSPGTNVVVGRNGSGKSNFFAAMRFVLSDAYQQMSREERQALLHEGSGSAVMSAYVEIIFDNSDRRFATQNDEVIIRRTIGLKKDEYSLDKKAVSKSEVMSLLEGAGFSKANPYYIVPQGRVTALTNMKESDRLTLLKEIAGTNTYESRRIESLKIMTDTNNKREKIDELLEYIKERLDELEEEKEELRGFQEKDRERRCLEYAYWHQQQEKIAAALAEIEETRLDGAGASSKDRQAFQRGENEIAELQQRLFKLGQTMEELEIERGQLNEDRKKAAKIKAAAEMKAKHLDETRQERAQAQQQREAELAEVRRQIQAKEKELVELSPEFKKCQAEESKAKENVDITEAKRQMLLTKQSLGSRFKSKEERDKFIQKELADLQSSIGHMKAGRMDQAETLEEVNTEIAKLEQEIQDIREKLSGYGANRDALDEELAKAREKREQLDEKKKGLKREDEKLRSRMASISAELHQAEGELRHTMDVPTARGLASVRRLRQERDIPGAYGTLAELMTVPQESYRLAIEQVAGASLFHYVVDNERTGTMLADYLYKHYGGRLTIIPLAQLRSRPVNMPKAKDALPLISKIEFDREYEKAFQHVFGRTIVCPNLLVASQYARSHGVDGITLDGDTTNKRGAMTGGYVDSQRSRLLAVQKVSQLRDQQDEQLAQARKNREEIEALEQEITRAIGEVQKLEQNKSRLSSGYDMLKRNLRDNDRQLDAQRDRRERIAAECAETDEEMKKLDDQITAMQTEMDSDFKRALAAQEERQLQELEEQIDLLRKEWNDASNRRRDVQTRKQKLEMELRKNLKPQEDELSSRAFDTLSSGTGNDRDAQKELRKAQKACAAAQTRWEENEKRKEETTAEIAKLEAEKINKEKEQTELARKIERQQKLTEKSAEKKALLTTQAAESAKNIKDLGVVPEEAFGKYARMKTDQISTRLKKVNEALKKYKHVNKKAFEQYNSFTVQQDQLLKRREELDTSQGSIEELILHLDQAKDEAIERTFKQVSREFSTIFERLVPAGHGRLVIQRRADRAKGRNAEESEDEPKGSVENYTGVGISVSFNSKMFDEQQKIQQLSGGQKSLCALCLIFAIQATETSPMVIFDEVDANLDAQYRTAVASLLESTSKEAGTQFICTTFRPEIVHVADKCYGVTFRNKTSTIECVPAEEALHFVEGQKR